MAEKRRVFMFDFFKGNKKEPKDIPAQAVMPESPSMTSALKLWSDMYSNPGYLSGRGASLNLASAIAAEHAKKVTAEFKSAVSGSPRADFLNAQYQRLIENIRVPVEFACAKGGLAFKPYVRNGSIYIGCIQADKFFPVEFDHAGRITGAVFVDQFMKGNSFFTRFEEHRETAEGIEISNTAHISAAKGVLGSSVPLSEIPEWADIQERCLLPGAPPLFSYFKMPLANFIDCDSPLGVSVFAKATSLIRDAERLYSQLLWEFKSGERKVYASIDALKPIGDRFSGSGGGLKFSLPSLDDGVIAALDSEDTNFFNVFSPEFREQSIINALNEILRAVEFQSGLAAGTFSRRTYQVKTAAEIISSEQTSHISCADIQKALSSALSGLVGAMDYYASLYKLAPDGEYNISFDFDDGVVEGSLSDQKILLNEISAGIMSPVEYRMRRYGESFERASEMVKLAGTAD